MFKSVFFDLDSTLVTIEGIDELARRKNVIEKVSNMTHMAMCGTVAFEDVFFKRLELIHPTQDDITWLGNYYIHHLTPGAEDVVSTLRRKGVSVFIISGGYNPAVTYVSRHLGIPDSHVFANSILFSKNGEYRGINKRIPLWRNNGKERIISYINRHYPGKSLLVGDSMADLNASMLTDGFICFAGVVHRQNVIQKSKIVIRENTILPILTYV